MRTLPLHTLPNPRFATADSEEQTGALLEPRCGVESRSSGAPASVEVCHRVHAGGLISWQSMRGGTPLGLLLDGLKLGLGSALG